MSAPRELEAYASRDQSEQELAAAVFASVLRWFAAGAVIVVLVLLVQLWREPTFSVGILIGTALIVPVPAFLMLMRTLGYPGTAKLFLVYGLIFCTYFQCEGGLTPGVALCMVTYLLLSCLFFGMRGARWSLVASFGSLVLSALVRTSGYVPRWEQEFWDPSNPIVWLRYAAVLFFIGGSLMSAFSQFAAGYRRIAAELRATLERERNERQQRERAEQALEHARRLEALAQYAGGLAHDFNNNLMVIMGGTSLIADDPQASEQVRALARDIGQSAEHGAEMVRHMLALGRKTPSMPQPISADALVQQCRGTLRKVLPESVKLAVEVEGQLELMVDVAGMQQALLNLALNARDALGECAGAFTLRVARRTIAQPPASARARPGAFVVVSCQDTGAGMDESTRTRLFEPFFTTKTAGKGTGLGLATVQRFVHEAGGFISVESSLGVGTTFHLHFPALEGSAKSLEGPAQGHALHVLDSH